MIKKNIEILKIFLLLLYIYHFASVFHRCNTKKKQISWIERKAISYCDFLAFFAAILSSCAFNVTLVHLGFAKNQK